MEQEKLTAIVEAVIMAAGHPMSLESIQKLFAEEEQPSTAEIRSAVDTIKARYDDHGIELKEVASGFRFQARQEYSEWIARLWEEKPARYSRALLETLVIIAYRQPVTRGEIEDIRGVAVSTSIVKTLLEREWVRVIGHRDVPGKPAILGTTKAFLDYFNLQSLEDLPTLQEIKDIDSMVETMDQQLTLALEEGADESTEAEVNAEAETEHAPVIEVDDPELEQTEAVIEQLIEYSEATPLADDVPENIKASAELDTIED